MRAETVSASDDPPRTWLARAAKHERLNFLVTNRLPRRAATLLMGRLSRVENRLVCGLSLKLWRLFAGDFRLEEAAETRFASLHECFTRALKPGARSIAPEPNVVASPCDGIVGARGRVEGTKLFQIKGFPYDLGDLLNDRALVAKYRDGVYVTLRLTSNMYHRFHAPLACRVREVLYVSGDTWNVNPIALRRVERLYCKNERAVIDLDLGAPGDSLALVPVAAILGREHPSALPSRAAHARVPRSESDCVRSLVRKGRGDGMVRARLHDHRVRHEALRARSAAQRKARRSEWASLCCSRRDPHEATRENRDERPAPAHV